MTLYILPLVDWGMGTILIGVFALVCIVLSLVVYSMVNSDKKKDNEDSEDPEDTEV